MRKSNYDKFPATKLAGNLIKGWSNIIELLRNEMTAHKAIAIDLYLGVHEEEVIKMVEKLPNTLLINTQDLFVDEEEVKEMTQRFMTDDVLFGSVSNLTITDYFDQDKVAKAKAEIHKCSNNIVIIGTGAAMIAPHSAILVYADMARWEIQQRFRRHEIKALGIDNRADAVSLQYKRGYFNDWRICDEYKSTLFNKVDYWLDTNTAFEPKLIDRETFMAGINKTIQTPFRVVPFFDPAPWGGQWMKEVCNLDRNVENYGWCFDCVPEENSLLLNVNGVNFEMPSINLILLRSTELLGEAVESRFGKDFPIRFDFLDTMEGGNLSLQVHPTTQYVHEHFGIHYTQDESYYLLDAKEDAHVYLGLKKEISPESMIEELRKAQRGEELFDTEKYVNKIPAKKHDHFLIPGGTVHCSGKDALVLEISSTPNIFTFKLWDWNRLGLDGKPRPINIERGKEVINWKRDTDYVKENLVNHVKKLDEGDGWREEKTGLHSNEFIETRRHWFTKPVTHHTNNGVNVLNLIEGEEAIIESPTGVFEPFVVHYAETFIIPASIGEYTISPYGKTIGKECGTIKAYVRI